MPMIAPRLAQGLLVVLSGRAATALPPSSAQGLAEECSSQSDELSLLQHGHRLKQPQPRPVQLNSPPELPSRLPSQLPSQLPKARAMEMMKLGDWHPEYASVPMLTVDLDAPPEKRWRNVTKYYKDLGVFPECCAMEREQVEALKPLLDAVHVDEEYRRELEGMAADIGEEGITADALILQNLGYELSGTIEKPGQLLKETAQMLLEDSGVDTKVGLQRIVELLPKMSETLSGQSHVACSGILAAMPDGTVIHGRNMDYNEFNVTLDDGRVLYWPEVTTDVVFYRSGKPLYTTVAWPGLNGIHTGMRFGGWTFEQNTRIHGVITDVLSGLLENTEGFMYTARRIMETTPDFETALKKMYASKQMSPQYFIMAGAKPYEGAVMTIDRGGKHLAPFTPPLRRLNSTTGDWYLLQTNDDVNKPARDWRRPTAMLKLSLSRQDQVSTDWMWDQMLGYAGPIMHTLYNPDTVFTSVYVPSTGYFKTVAHLGNGRFDR